MAGSRLCGPWELVSAEGSLNGINWGILDFYSVDWITDHAHTQCTLYGSGYTPVNDRLKVSFA